MNIVEFIEDARVIGDKSLSPAQRTALKVAYGLALNSEELGLYRILSGRPEYTPREWYEMTFILGRRAGKSDKLASNIALFEACVREHRFSVGETGVVMIVSSELRRQSRIVFDYCEHKLRRSPILRRLIKKTTADEIQLANGVSIQVFPCNVARTRGQSIIAFIGDECAFWRSEGKNIDREVLDAARPGLSFPYSRMVKISSPYMMRGEIWSDYSRYWGKPAADVLVLQGSTELFRPDYSRPKLEAAKRKDPTAYESEYMARFRTDMAGMYDAAVIDAAVNFDRPRELPYRADAGPYVAFVDVAGGGGRDHYAVAIGHRAGEKLVVDVVRSRAPKFNPEEVTAQYCELLKSYGITRAQGDKFSGDWASNAFAKFGISYERAEKSKSEIYLESEGPFNTGRVDLPEREALLAQLKGLVRKTRQGGRDSVDTDSGQPEDEANVACGAIWLLNSGASAGAGFFESDVEISGPNAGARGWVERAISATMRPGVNWATGPPSNNPPRSKDCISTNDLEPRRKRRG